MYDVWRSVFACLLTIGRFNALWNTTRSPTTGSTTWEARRRSWNTVWLARRSSFSSATGRPVLGLRSKRGSCCWTPPAGCGALAELVAGHPGVDVMA